MSVGTLLLHFISLFSISVIYIYMFFILSEGRRSAARTKPAHYNNKIRRARNDVSIFLALLSCPEGGESLVREDVENNVEVSCVYVV